MKIVKLAPLVISVILLQFGCAQKQEDVAKIEQEMMAQEGQVGDTTAAHATPGETPVADAAVPDVGAIPDEGSQFRANRPAGNGYTVQVAACEDLAYANHLVDTYLSRGYDPFMTSTVDEGQTYYRVRIGSFEGYGDAKALKDELVDKYSLHGAWVDRVSN